jgi:hypothetical protein
MLTRRRRRRRRRRCRCRRTPLSCHGENRREVPRRRVLRWRSSCMRGMKICSGFLDAFYLLERHVISAVLILPSKEMLI